MVLEALRNACSDPSPQIRLRAAKELGAEGRGILIELAEGLADDEMSAQAVSALGSELPSERTIDLLVHALRRRLLQTARACVEVLGRTGPAAVDTLAKVIAREKGELSVAAAAALGETGSASAEPPLILALQREQADLQVAAASALGRVGSSAAVLPLKEAAERFSRDPDLRRATRQAIAEIQSRVQGASPGQLSLAGGEAGQLSLAEAEAGQLSLAGDPAGQLSFPSGEPGQLSVGGEET
jgi:HEAT repeat protein